MEGFGEVEAIRSDFPCCVFLSIYYEEEQMGLVGYCIDDPPCQVNIHTFLNFYTL